MDLIKSFIEFGTVISGLAGIALILFLLEMRISSKYQSRLKKNMSKKTKS